MRRGPPDELEMGTRAPFFNPLELGAQTYEGAVACGGVAR